MYLYYLWKVICFNSWDYFLSYLHEISQKIGIVLYHWLCYNVYFKLNYITFNVTWTNQIKLNTLPSFTQTNQIKLNMFVALIHTNQSDSTEHITFIHKNQSD